MLGQRSIYHKGWLASTVHPPLSSWGKFELDEWELYHLAEDRGQTTNVAAEHPDRLQSLKDLWFYYAGIYNGLPLDDRSALEQVLAERPEASRSRSQYVYFPGTADVPEEAGVNIIGRSYTIAGGIDVDADADGVIFAAGGNVGGHALYVKDRKLHYTYNWVGTYEQDVVAASELAPGRHVVAADFTRTGASTSPQQPGHAGVLKLFVDDELVGEGEIITQPGHFCLVGDGICVGRDSGSAVSRSYAPPNRFTGGSIDKVVVDVSGESYIDHEATVRGWFIKD
jgi:arylsulfatase